MECVTTDVDASGVLITYRVDGRDVGRAYLYVLSNSLHDRPFGFMEDVFVDSSMRGQGIGSDLVRQVIEEAKCRDCYKLICTARFEKEGVRGLYERLGFEQHGIELRMNF